VLLGTEHVVAPDAAMPLMSALNEKPSHRS
jgi:hypothetical protein